MDMLPLMDKDTVRFITQNITPEEAEYVAGIKSTLDDTKTQPSSQDDIIYITKIMSFADKFKNLHWAANNLLYHDALDKFGKSLEDYKDDIAENIQSIIGLFNGNAISKLELPIGEDPLQIINELKICVANWFNLHKDDMEYEGCRSLTSTFLDKIRKYIYIFRLCKVSMPEYTAKF